MNVFLYLFALFVNFVFFHERNAICFNRAALIIDFRFKNALKRIFKNYINLITA